MSRLAAGRIGARGPVRVLLANANAFAVTGTLAGTSRTTVELALSTALRRELQRKRKLVLRLSVAVQDPAGNRRTVRHQVTPRLKARHRA